MNMRCGKGKMRCARDRIINNAGYYKERLDYWLAELRIHDEFAKGYAELIGPSAAERWAKRIRAQIQWYKRKCDGQGC